MVAALSTHINKLERESLGIALKWIGLHLNIVKREVLMKSKISLHLMLLILLGCGLFVLVVGCSGGEEAAESSNGGGSPKPSDKSQIVPFPADQVVGMIRGKVLWEGDIPKVKSLPKPGNDKFCEAHAGQLIDEKLLVNTNHTVRNVFVYIKTGADNWDYNNYQGMNDPSKPVVLTQEGCRYIPHVLGIMARQKLEIHCKDATTHNVHLNSKRNGAFNFVQRKGGVNTKSFNQKEVMAILTCDIHSWMKAYVAVLFNPFYKVTTEDGAFELGKLPKGTYTVEAWHEKLGVQSQTVTITDGDASEIRFTFKK